MTANKTPLKGKGGTIERCIGNYNRKYLFPFQNESQIDFFLIILAKISLKYSSTFFVEFYVCPENSSK